MQLCFHPLGIRVLISLFVFVLINGGFTPLFAAEFITPVEKEIVSLLPSDWHAQIEQRKVTPNNSEARNPLIKNDRSFPLPVKFSWKLSPGETELILEISQKPDFSPLERRISCGSANTLEVFNLTPGKRWYCRLVTKNGANISSVCSFETDAEFPRLLRVPGITNCRDLGGYRTLDGQRVRLNMLFRSCAMDEKKARITAEGKRVLLEELHIATDLDLRTKQQSDTWHKYSKIPQGQSPIGENIRYLLYPINAYQTFTPEQDKAYRAVFTVFTQKGNYPILFHCSGGADRTGILGFLLNALLGVSKEELLLDYETTSLSWYPRPRTISYFRKFLKNFEALGTPNENWQVKAERFWKKIGVTDEEIQAFRAIMLEELKTTKN